jgi:hypothetical protein
MLVLVLVAVVVELSLAGVVWVEDDASLSNHHIGLEPTRKRVGNGGPWVRIIRRDSVGDQVHTLRQVKRQELLVRHRNCRLQLERHIDLARYCPEKKVAVTLRIPLIK